MIPTETIRETRGQPSVELSLARRFRNGTKQFLLVDSQKAGTSCWPSISGGGRPSGMVSNWKCGKLSRATAPVEYLSRRPWLNAVLTKVMWKPLKWRSLASFIVGFTWPWAGNGMQTAWGFWESVREPVA
ncbi:hypothetical protein SLA2020_011570 [Shorea laevis]